VVLIPFPYSDLSQAKRRPALIIADVGMGDFVLCQITSRSYADRLAIPLLDSDFAEGGLKRESFLRIGKLFTANVSIIIGVAGANFEDHLRILRTDNLPTYPYKALR
jgi:mRNA interferase MazF